MRLHAAPGLVLGLVLGLALVPHAARATVHNEPVAFQVVEASRIDAHHVRGVLEARALLPGTLALGTIEVDRGRARPLALPQRGALAAGAVARMPFAADVDDSTARFKVNCTFDGVPHAWAFDMRWFAPGAADVRRAARRVSMGAAGEPAAASAPRCELDVHVAPAAARTRNSLVPGERDVTVRGRVVYYRPDLTSTGGTHFAPATLGAEGVTVVIEHDDGVVHWYLTKTETNADGSFSQTFHWIPLNPFAPNPNLTLRVDFSNDHFAVRNPVGLQTYSFHTGTWNSVLGDLDAGTLTGSDDQQDKLDLLNTLMKGRAWYRDHENYTLDYVNVFYPEPTVFGNFGGSGSWYNAADNGIHLGADRAWDAPTALHEYGHFFINNHGRALTPDYCNGVCDGTAPWPTPWACGHCRECAETDHDAWSEGWPDWIAEVQTLDQGLASRYAFESEDDRKVCAATGQLADPLRTELFLQAMLRDLWDGVRDDDPGLGPVTMGDVMCVGTHPIFEVTTQDQPVTTQEFIEDFEARYPQWVHDFYTVRRHNGFPQADFTPPAQVTGLVSSSHRTGLLASTHDVALAWDPSSDAGSGLALYEVTIDGTYRDPSTYSLVTFNIQTRYLADTTSATVNVPYSGCVFEATVVAIDHDGNRSAPASLSGLAIGFTGSSDLRFTTPSAWHASTVARPAADASAAQAPLPSAQLPGNIAGTWWNAAYYNAGPGTTPDSATVCAQLLVDGIAKLDSTLGRPLAPGYTSYVLNKGPVSVPGGRHAFVTSLDPRGAINESDETNNLGGRQWIWTPWTLTPNAAGMYPAPPAAGALAGVEGDMWFNSFGLRMSVPDGSWWNLVWVAAPSSADYDCRLHWASSSPDTGFGANLGWSARPAGYLDAVLVNRNVLSQSAWDVGVINARGASSAFFAKQVTSSKFVFGDSLDVTFPANEYAIVRELEIGPTQTGPVTIVLREHPRHQRLHLAFYDRTFAAGALLDADTVVVADTTTGVTRLDLTVSQPGSYGLVVFTDPRDNPTTPTFAMQVIPARPDIRPQIFLHWHSPLVPRPAADASPTWAPLPDTLVGNAASTYLNLAFVDDSPTGTVPFSSAVALDGVTRWTFDADADSPWGQTFVNSTKAITVGGGRHTLTLDTDTGDRVLESDEGNNSYGEQYVWSPRPLTMNQYVWGTTPPARTGGWSSDADSVRWFNCDGLRTPVYYANGPYGYWGGIVTLPRGDVDLRVHEVTPGTKNGFGPNLGLSAWGEGQPDFALFNFNMTPFRAFDIGVLNVTDTTSMYFAEATRSGWLPYEPNATFGPYTFDGTHLMQLYEVWLDAGPHAIRIAPVSGLADLGVAVYGPWAPVYMRSDALGASWKAPGGTAESFNFNAPDMGPYCVAVWLQSLEGSAMGSYTLDVRSGTLAASGPAVPATTALAVPRPNPSRGDAELAFTLARDGEATLAVYDVRGARLRTLASGARAAGAYHVRWDGCDERGHAVAPGVYLVRLEANGTSATRKLVRTD